jgi:hypothetical protein
MVTGTMEEELDSSSSSDYKDIVGELKSKSSTFTYYLDNSLETDSIM